MALELTDDNFDEKVVTSNQVAVVDFWAEWCGPCRMIGPIIAELATEYEGKAVIGKVNVDDCPGVSSKFGIRNIPTVLYFKNGAIADKQVGAAPKSVLKAKLDAIL